MLVIAFNNKTMRNNDLGLIRIIFIFHLNRIDRLGRFFKRVMLFGREILRAG
jgi:hypothetical protein